VKTFAKDVLPLFVAEKSDGEGLRVYVHKVFKWEKIREAHDEMEANKNCGKIIVEVS
jgi:NADPH:quinone reductase-like Zn-dependent oxidoreductase